MSENGITGRLAAFIVNQDASKIPEEIREHAKYAFLDWLAVTYAGKDDPLVLKLMKYADAMGGAGQAAIVGHPGRRSVRDAALINGAASHALDYDDTLVNFYGHPSVTIFPALLALAEWKGKSGREFLDAYLIGLQAGTAVGASAGPMHYMGGWHATATLGHFASAAACARLLGLGEKQTVYAFGIAGTQSAGLKRVFGTMCKPFHAGMAAERGMQAALLAADGFDSVEDILEGEHGWFHCMKGKANEGFLKKLGESWEAANLAQKYHASCHATHSPMEGAVAILEKNGLALGDLKELRIFASQLALDAAGKLDPQTGVEGKFSIPFCTANLLLGGRTDETAFTDERVRNPEVRELMKKIVVTLDQKVIGISSKLEAETADGTVHKLTYDILKQIPPLSEKRVKVRAKFDGVLKSLGLGEKGEILAAAVLALDEMENMRSFAEGL